MKKVVFLILFTCILVSSCSQRSKEIIKLSQHVSITGVDYLGDGKYEVYFSYKWRDGHMIGTGIMTNQKMNVGDEKTYIEFEKENEDGQTENYTDLRD